MASPTVDPDNPDATYEVIREAVISDGLLLGGTGTNISAVTNVSRFVESIRVDEHLVWNEADRIEITLININNQFTGLFKTSDLMDGTLITTIKTCDGETVRRMKAFHGQVQKITYNPKTVTIVGSCGMGTLTDYIARDYDAKKRKISDVVTDLLDMHDSQPDNVPYNTRVIDIVSDDAFDHQWPIFKASQVSYMTALSFLAERVGAIWYVDEERGFYFVDPKNLKGTYDLDPYMMNPEDAGNVIGHINILRVVGSGVYPPSSEYSYIETHKRYFAEARNEMSIAEHGELAGPTLVCPNLSGQEEVSARAENLKEYYRVAENIAKPKITGFLPPLMSFVTYHAGIKTLASCDDPDTYGIEPFLVDGLVTRRIIEWSTRGFLVELEVATSVPEEGLSYITPLSDAIIQMQDETTDPDSADQAFIDATDSMSDDDITRAVKDLLSPESAEIISNRTDEIFQEMGYRASWNGSYMDYYKVVSGAETLLGRDTPEYKEAVSRYKDAREMARKEYAEASADEARPSQDTAEDLTTTAYPIVEYEGEDWMLVPETSLLEIFDLAHSARPGVDYGEIVDGSWKLIYRPETGEAVLSKTGRQHFYRVAPWNDLSSNSVEANLAAGWPDYS